MKTYQKIKLRNRNYYLEFEVEYRNWNQNGNQTIMLMYKESDDYFDSDDIENLIEEVQKRYSEIKLEEKKYGTISLMMDATFLEENIPHLNGFYTFKDKNQIPFSVDYVSKEDINKYKKML